MEKLPFEKNFSVSFLDFFLHLNILSQLVVLANNPIQLTKPAEG